MHLLNNRNLDLLENELIINWHKQMLYHIHHSPYNTWLNKNKYNDTDQFKYV